MPRAGAADYPECPWSDPTIDPHSCELRLIGAHIDEYDQGNLANHEPDRDSKLLMKCGEIRATRQAEARDDSYDFGVGRVVSVEPIFVVSDVARAVAHYEQLGFSTSHHDEGYAFAHRNELTIHLAGPGVDLERVGRGSIYMHVDDADALAEEWTGAGIDLVPPQDFEYGKREGSHEDPDGNLIRFGSPLRR